MKEIPRELAPCGVYCGACPSFDRTCLGCAAESRAQKRTSKWGCKIRACCYEKAGKDFCLDCQEYPCPIYRKKLLDPHPGDPMYQYRHEIPRVFSRLREMTREEYLQFQARRWTCPHCAGKVDFYHYRCRDCGKDVDVTGGNDENGKTGNMQ